MNGFWGRKRENGKTRKRDRERNSTLFCSPLAGLGVGFSPPQAGVKILLINLVSWASVSVVIKIPMGCWVLMLISLLGVQMNPVCGVCASLPLGKLAAIGCFFFSWDLWSACLGGRGSNEPRSEPRKETWLCNGKQS